MPPLNPVGRSISFPPSTASGTSRPANRIDASSSVGRLGSGDRTAFSLDALAPGVASQKGTPESSRITGMLVDQVRHVNEMQTGADAMVHSMITGGDVSEAEVLTAVQKADLAFRMLLQIRNKLMDAYREIQQIQI